MAVSTPQSSTDASKPRITLTQTSTGPCAVVVGHWTAAQLTVREVWTSVVAALQSVPAGTTDWDLRPIQGLDHLGAQLLWNRWGRTWPAAVQVIPSQRAVIERVAKYATAAPRIPEPTWQARFNALGALLLQIFGHVTDLTRLIGQLLLDVMKLVMHPREGPWRDMSGHLYRIGATALPITALVGFLIGVVLAYLTALQLKQFGADAFIVDILGVSLIRELGPMLAAILIAGRSGSAITAQIGVMRVTEELDAMRVMGIAHGYRLVMPRALALAIVMPLVAVWTTFMALLGGMIAADLVLGISPSFFVNALPKAVDIANLALALGKSVVFGLLIALIACHFGLRVEPNTESLGKGTTASVVTSITIVIIVDAIFAVVFKDVGI
ncbi:MAG TPA: ABC transporter permease [Burkholderiales bacterium]|nr:ABC transporter permease [Burkholderiales bacterium]